MIGQVLSISQYVFEKKLIAFGFDEELTHSVAQVTMQHHVKTLSSPTLCGRSGAFIFLV